MTALNRTPSNTNFLQPSKFILSFGRLPTVQYFCQEANIPGVSLGNVDYSTPFVDIPIAGNKLNYGEFNVNFLVDEDIQSWAELYKWFLAIAAPTNLQDRARYNQEQSQLSKANYYSDSTLTVMSSLNNPLVRINFHRMFPVSLSDIQFDTQQSADTIITARATFRYEYFDITTA